MGLTSALNTSLNGLVLNETSIDVLGNNIANSGTNGFKSSKVLFATQLSKTFSAGSRPTATSGGTNPRQVGFGANTTAIVRDFSQGNVTNSTSPSDLAIQGDGFFILQGSSGPVYSRAGNFTRSSENLLVNPQGQRVQGYAVDENFQLISTSLSNLSIPLGELNIAQQTRQVTMSGALLPTGTVGDHGAYLQSGDFFDPTVDPVNGLPAATSKLVDLRDANSGAANALFTANQTLTFSPKVGGRAQETISLTVDANTTVQNLIDFMQDGLSIHNEAGVPADGLVNDGGSPATFRQPGVSLQGNKLEILGNRGSLNDISILAGDLAADGLTAPLGFNKQTAANGESASTDFVIYDSLGTPLGVKIATALESVTATSTTYRWYVDSADDSRRSGAVGSGTITFDGNGKVIAGGTGNVTFERQDSAAVSPMQVSLDFNSLSGISSQSAGSRISMNAQDGSPPGTLVNFVIDEAGTINGVFDNGLIRTLGQVMLARFSNTQGLLEAGNTAYQEGGSSGPPILTVPGNFGAGSIRSAAIEISNTDIGQNLVDLIVASTNYRGNARVISSVQQLVDELLVLGR